MAKWTAFRGKLMMDNTDFNKSLAGSGKEVRKLADVTKREMRGVDDSFKASAKEAGIFFGAISAGVIMSVNDMKDFERELLNVQYTLEDTSGVARREFQAIAREAAKITGAPAALIAQVQTSLVGSGHSRRQVDDLSKVIGGFIDATGRTDAGLADKLAAGGIATNRRTADLLEIYAAVGRQSRGQMQGGVDLLAQFMPALAPTGQALGFSTEETASLLGAASWQTPRPRRAGSGVRMILEEAVKPDSKFAKNFEETFGESFAAAMRGQGLRGFIEAMNRALENWGAAGFIGSFGSAETGSLAAALVGDSGRLDSMLASAFEGGAVDRVMEGYEGSLNEVSGVLTETLADFKIGVGAAFEGDAIAWMETLTNIFENDEVSKAAENFLEAGRLLSEPMRTLAEPMASLAANIVNLLGENNIAGNMSYLEALVFGVGIARVGGRAVGGAKGIRLPTSRSTAGLGGLVGRVLPGASKGLKTAGRVANVGANLGLTGLLGYGAYQAIFNEDPDAFRAALAEDMSLLGSEWNDQGILGVESDLKSRRHASRMIQTEDLGAQMDSFNEFIQSFHTRGDMGGSATRNLSLAIDQGLISESLLRGALTVGEEGGLSLLAEDFITRALERSDVLATSREASADYGTQYANMLRSPTLADTKYDADLMRWQNMMANNPTDLLMAHGGALGIGEAFSERFGMIDTAAEAELWEQIKDELKNWLPQIASATGNTANNTDPTNPDNCAPLAAGGSFGTYNVLETVG